MGQGVVIEELHGDRGRKLVGRPEQANQQGGAQELIDEPIADVELDKE